MNRLPLFSLLLAVGLTGCATRPPRHPAPASPRNGVLPVVAVTNFENRSGFTGQWNLGSGMADLLVAELMDSGQFTVLDANDAAVPEGPYPTLAIESASGTPTGVVLWRRSWH